MGDDSVPTRPPDGDRLIATYSWSDTLDQRLDEMTEAMNRGWEDRDSRIAMTLQSERAGVDVALPPERLQGLLD